MRINLLWAVKMKKLALEHNGNVQKLKDKLLKLAGDIREDDISRCHNLAINGSNLISDASK